MTFETPGASPNRAQRRAAERAAGKGRGRRTTAAVLAASSTALATTAALVAGASGPAAAAATETVDSTADSGGGSLRDAITNVSDGGTIDFNLPAGSTITLASPITIDKSVTITGPGSTALTIDADHNGRAFYIGDGTATVLDVTISGLKFVNGSPSGHGGAIAVVGEHVTLTDTDFQDNTAEGEGGAISVSDTAADFTIASSHFSGNTAAGGDGGAIRLRHVYGAVTISDTVITGNSASDDGGGVYAEQNNENPDPNPLRTITITSTEITGNTADDGGGGAMLDDVYGLISISGSTISGNSTADWGGGLYLEDAWGGVSISGSTLSGNTAGAGGGIATWSGYGPVSITGTTISNNTVTLDGGGVLISNLLDRDGQDDATVTVSTSTISGNSAGRSGGGLAFPTFENYSNDADIAILDSTISGNTADSGGGGVWGAYSYGTTSIIQSTLTGNVAHGGDSGYDGGAVTFRQTERAADSLSIVQSTISGNTGVDVGGVYLPEQNIIKSAGVGAAHANAREGDDAAPDSKHTSQGGSHTRSHSFTISRATIVGTILAGNAGEDLGMAGVVTASSSIFSKIDSGTTFTDGGGNQLNVTSLLLGPLQDNGGPTETMELLPGSPAIDTGAVPPPSYPTNDFDQRGDGYTRVVGGIIDVGAFEVQPVQIQPTFTG